MRDEHVAQVGLVLRQDDGAAAVVAGVVVRPRQNPLDERRRFRSRRSVGSVSGGTVFHRSVVVRCRSRRQAERVARCVNRRARNVESKLVLTELRGQSTNIINSPGNI